MKSNARRMAICSMTTALVVVLMFLGAVLELGMYASPLFSGILLIIIGHSYGSKYQTIVWISSSMLCFMLVPNAEQNLFYFCLLGWYPILRPKLQKLPALIRICVKLLIFNSISIAIEALIIYLLLPEAITGAMAAILLILGNITFLAYDYLIPRLEILLLRISRKI